MHRNDGPNFTTIGGLRFFEDINAPGTVGTTMISDFANAVQEEIAGVIEGVGLALNPSGTADTSAGWGQLYRAIFETSAINTSALSDSAVTAAKLDSGAVITDKILNGAVTNVKIADYDLSKGFGQIAVSEVAGPATNTWTASALSDTRSLSTIGFTGAATRSAQTTTFTANGVDSVFGADGIRFDGNNANLKMKILDVSNKSEWSVTTPGSALFDTGILKSRNIWFARLRFKNNSLIGTDPGDGSQYDAASVQFRWHTAHLVNDIEADAYLLDFAALNTETNWVVAINTQKDYRNDTNLEDAQMVIFYN